MKQMSETAGPVPSTLGCCYGRTRNIPVAVSPVIRFVLYLVSTNLPLIRRSSISLSILSPCWPPLEFVHCLTHVLRMSFE